MTERDGQEDVQRGDGGTRPVPDPTVLTTEALQRGIESLKELLETRIVCVEETTVQKIDAIEARLAREENHRIEGKTDTRLVVDAALAAQKAAADKSEIATTRSIESLKAELSTSIGALAQGLSDVKDRTTAGEATKTGGQEQKESQHMTNGTLVAVAVAVVGVLGLIIAFFNLLTGTP